MLADTLQQFRVCAWRTVSYRAAEMAAARASVEMQHPGDAIVTSCQRLEAYGFGPCGCEAPDRLSGYEALERLAAIAAGLESVVLGEDQVVGQVRAAFHGAPRELRTFSDIALSASRALRAQTQLESHAGHLLDKALRLSTMSPGGSLLVLGVGAMGRLVAERATELGFEVTVAARREPATGFPGSFVELGKVPGLPGFDVIVGCLGSGAGEIAPRFLPPARLLVDLGTPRNFNVLSGPGAIAIADMLDDEATRPHAVARRRKLRRQLGEILRQRLQDAESDGRSPAGALRTEIEAIRREEVARALRLHPGADAAAIEAVTRALVDRLFHRTTARLKSGDDADFARELASLFSR